MRSLALIICLTVLCGCDREVPLPQQADLGRKARTDNLNAKVEKAWNLSDTETVKVVVVPGYPLGERCVIYSNERGNTMQCREITPNRQ